MPQNSHPIVARRIVKAKKVPKIIIYVIHAISKQLAWLIYIALKNGSNIALLNAVTNVIIEEKLYDKSLY